MAKLKKKSDSFFYLKLTVALIFLINPCIKTFDILPDFVSALIIIPMLRDFCDRAPGFSDAKDAFVKLGFVSFLKIPAILIMAVIRNNDTNDNDIVTLFCFVFAVFEGYLLILAVKRLFDALMHVGMRGADAAIRPFPILCKKASMKPETLRVIWFVFAVVRSFSYALPEMILLATSDRISDPNKIYNAWAFYPKALSAGIVITLLLGIASAVLFFKYIKAIKKEGILRSTVVSLHTGAELDEIEGKILAKSIKFRLKLLMISSLFTLDIIFDNSDVIDILPNFIYGIVLFVSVSLLFSKTKAKVFLQIFTAIYTLVALVCYILLSDFLSSYNYSSLINKAAKDAFVPVILSSGSEFVCLVVCMVTLGILLFRFAKQHTGIETIFKLNSEKDKKQRRGAIVLSLLGTFTGLAKFLGYIFEFNQVSSAVLINGQERLISTSLFPWFNSVNLIIALIFIGYSFHYFTSLCEDIDLNYS